MTAPRPPIGARVRVRGTTGIPGVAGRLGIVAGYHEDGVAIVVEIPKTAFPLYNDRITVEPSDVDWNRECVSPADCGYASEGWCPRCEPFVAQPARLRGSAT